MVWITEPGGVSDFQKMTREKNIIKRNVYLTEEFSLNFNLIVNGFGNGKKDIIHFIDKESSEVLGIYLEGSYLLVKYRVG